MATVPPRLANFTKDVSHHDITLAPNPSQPQVAEIVTKFTITESERPCPLSLQCLAFPADGRGFGHFRAAPFHGVFVQAIGTDLVALLSTGAAASVNTVRFMDHPTRIAVSCTGTYAGQVATARVPTGTVVEVKLSIATRGKGKSGRKYISGLPAASVTLDELSSGVATSFATWAESLAEPFTDADGNTWEMVTVSQKPEINSPSTPFILNSVASATISTALGHLKKQKMKMND